MVIVRVSELEGVPETVTSILADQGIDELYPPQSAAIEAGILSGENLVASVPTASGKTLMAVLAMLAAVERGGKALYIVPLRALASEKHAEFELYEECGVEVGISTGNYESSDEWLASRDVIVATSEKVDSLIRNGASWIGDLTCVVADEVHLVDDADRGPTLEVTLAKLHRINPGIQTVALSATVGNAAEIASWLDAALVDSEWRPIELRRGVHYGQALHLEDGSTSELPVEAGESQTAALVRDTLDEGGSTLVFVNSRRNAEAEARRLATAVASQVSEAERDRLGDVAEEVRDVSDTETSEDLASAVERGAAFHHAGLCVTGDTQILRGDGTYESIKEIVENHQRDATIIGLREYKLTSSEITSTFQMGDRPVLEIQTKTGNQIRVSRNHPLPTLGSRGIEWVPAGELGEGRFLARPRDVNINPDPPDLRELVPDEYRTYRKNDIVREMVSEVDVSDLDVDYYQQYARNRNISIGGFRALCQETGTEPSTHLDRIMSDGGQRPVNMPEQLNEDVCWLIGAVAGDGHLSSGNVHLSGNEVPLTEFEKVVKDQFGREVTRSRGGSGTPIVRLNSKLVSQMIEEHFGIPRGKKGLDLRLPDVPLDNDQLAAYIAGVFDTDGSVSARSNVDGSPRVEFYSISEILISQLKTAFLRFGIIAYKDIREKEGDVEVCHGREITSHEDVHRLTIYGVDQLCKFNDTIGPRHPEKAEKLRLAIDKNPPGGRGQSDVIPSGVGPYVRTIRESSETSMEDLESQIPKATLSRFERQLTPMKRSTFQSMAEALDCETLRQIGHSDIYWDRITSVEERGTERLYDLSTETSNFIANGIIAHNTSKQRSIIEDAFRERLVKVVSATPTLAAGVNTPSRRVVVRDWRRYDGTAGGMVPLSTLEVHQMFGRAGRPGLDPYGEALVLGSSHDELEELFERYVWAEPEPVRSKLAAEPALRTHVLSTIADGFASTRDGLLEFLDRTLYATQTTDTSRLPAVADRVVEYLVVNDFVDRSEKNLQATGLGHTVSRLYLDPMSAAHIIDGLETAGDEPSALGLYHLISRTPDMYQLYLRSGDRERYTELHYERESELLGASPSEFEEGAFEDWLAALKTGRLLEAWASEVDEDRLTDRYGVGPGDIRAKVATADWLLGATERLATELDVPSVQAIARARKRVEHGVAEELLDLVSVRNVGRKRARWLFDAGITSRVALREADPARVLGALKGRRGTAETILENVGHPEPSLEDVAVEESDDAPRVTGASAARDDEDQANLGDF